MAHYELMEIYKELSGEVTQTIITAESNCCLQTTKSCNQQNYAELMILGEASAWPVAGRCGAPSCLRCLLVLIRRNNVPLSTLIFPKFPTFFSTSVCWCGNT